ncbi:MAG: hypothetical protein JJE07_02635 [Flavobacteriaceae bacterium]|nr:hypothetical protein [Flavobacteriaceae bacterium]
MKEYSSFKEIDRDLEILKLQMQIDKEEIKLHLNQTKENLSPISLMGSVIGSIAKKALELKLASKIFGVKRVIASTKK